jgi:protein ImuB
MAVFLPYFATDLRSRAQRRSNPSAESPRRTRSVSDDPAPLRILFEEVRGQRVLAARCQRCAALGLRPGMPLTDALASLPSGASPIVEPASPARDAKALQALAERLTRFSPMVATDRTQGVDAILLDIAGCEHLFDGEVQMVRAVVRTLKRLGLTSRVAIAGTFACALAVARFGPHDYASVAPGKEPDALAPLPLRALGLGDDTVEALGELGVRTIGQAMHLRRRDLPVRFGDALLLRLDMAMGRALETIEPVRPLAPIAARRNFEGPTTHQESILLAVQEQLGALCDHLRSRGLGVRLLRTRLERVGPRDDPRAQPVDTATNLARPSRDPKHLWALLRPRLESVDMGFGVEGVELTALRTGRLRHAQTVADFEGNGGRTVDETGVETARAELIDALSARLGEASVLKVEARESHIPERAFTLTPATSEPGQGGNLTGADRPTRLFEEPERIDAISLVPDGPVLSVRWRGATHRVISSVGPERIGPEWWVVGDRETRDYVKAQLEDGRWVWLFRRFGSAGPQGWFMHGVWA